MESWGGSCSCMIPTFHSPVSHFVGALRHALRLCARYIKDSTEVEFPLCESCWLRMMSRSPLSSKKGCGLRGMQSIMLPTGNRASSGFDRTLRCRHRRHHATETEWVVADQGDARKKINTPVIVLSAKDSVDDRIKGLHRQRRLYDEALCLLRAACPRASVDPKIRRTF